MSQDPATLYKRIIGIKTPSEEERARVREAVEKEREELFVAMHRRRERNRVGKLMAQGKFNPRRMKPFDGNIVHLVVFPQHGFGAHNCHSEARTRVYGNPDRGRQWSL